jgi:hypothetical protein
MSTPRILAEHIAALFGKTFTGDGGIHDKALSDVCGTIERMIDAQQDRALLREVVELWREHGLMNVHATDCPAVSTWGPQSLGIFGKTGGGMSYKPSACTCVVGRVTSLVGGGS